MLIDQPVPGGRLYDLDIADHASNKDLQLPYEISFSPIHCPHNQENSMPLSLTRLILYVRDVNLLASFYQTHFGLPITEEIDGEWAVLNAGAIEIALHRVGVPYREHSPQGNSSNAKVVFSVPSGLLELREQLVHAGVRMRDVKRYDGFPYSMCDGEDPEGNVFQLSQPD
jgi:catechol 2,3-dioxygenase-like lactoylglutathione lyase family enzyme